MTRKPRYAPKPRPAERTKTRRRGPGGNAGRPRSAAADKAILQAAIKLFRQHGFDGVTFEEVAEAAAVARTTVYRRWSTKEDLIAQAIASERGTGETGIAAGKQPSGLLRDQLIDAAAAVFAAPDYRSLVARLIGSVPDHPELMSVYWREYLVPRREAMVALLERARSERLIRDDVNPNLVLDLIGGAVMHELLVRPGRRSSAELRAYLHKVIHAIGIEVTAAAGAGASKPARRNGRESART